MSSSTFSLRGGALFFLSIVALRILCMVRQAEEGESRAPLLTAAQLPVYSVLVPLFRETAVLGQLIDALSALRYPAAKLDIKLILEAEDLRMRRALRGMALPPWFEIVVVSKGLPQTKPRALNYALQLCRGELVTIYDAEDIPEPGQLMVAARRFASGPPELACLQAKLAPYNGDENWLTRHFTAEYAVLFGVVLPVLARHGLPLPLGGTSNHFRIEALRGAGAWDPFNVTEDADLGLRLARLGYAAATLDSHTYEEANTELANWMRQRARWLKGFLATWLVHTRHPVTFLREVGVAGVWSAHAMTFGVFISALLHPFCMAVMIAGFLSFPLIDPEDGPAILLLTAANLFVLVAGYGTGFVLARRALDRRGIFGWWGTLLTLPAYWFLMSAAAWLALWQFIREPFHWNKTEHGLSRQTVRRVPSRARN